MVEMHGWITLRETYRVADDEDMERVLDEIRKEIRRLVYPALQIKVCNGQDFIEFSLYTNHMSKAVRDLVAFFEKVGRAAEGSYGLLYIHNDEDDQGYNEFVVHRLARGRVTIFRDAFLSPLIPTVENEDDLG